jgi:hypothetical protein
MNQSVTKWRRQSHGPSNRNDQKNAPFRRRQERGQESIIYGRERWTFFCYWSDHLATVVPIITKKIKNYSNQPKSWIFGSFLTPTTNFNDTETKHKNKKVVQYGGFQPIRRLLVSDKSTNVIRLLNGISPTYSAAFHAGH